jgi:hypothetical protein
LVRFRFQPSFHPTSSLASSSSSSTIVVDIFRAKG